MIASENSEHSTLKNVLYDSYVTIVQQWRKFASGVS
jgi:hypothetical protein